MYIETDFNKLANDAYHILDQQYKSGNLTLPEVNVEIEPTRLHWKNVKEFLKLVRRHPDHFMNWLKTELPNQEINWFSGSKSDGLIIHGKRQKKSNITNMILKYVNTFIICTSCKHADTIMTKSNKHWEFECIDCGMKKFII